jgi:hypothetical protein
MLRVAYIPCRRAEVANIASWQYLVADYATRSLCASDWARVDRGLRAPFSPYMPKVTKILRERTAVADASASAGVWGATSAVVAIGAAMGFLYLNPQCPGGYLGSLARIDGQNYRKIAESGYEFKPESPSYVAFFPAYPLAARWLAATTHMSIVTAELTVSNGCCLIAFVVMGAYLKRRSGSQRGLGQAGDSTSRAPPDCDEARRCALLALSLLPTSFFFRVAYSESMFLCLMLVSFYGMASCWRTWLVAGVVGLATAVRPTGVVLLIPFCWYAWHRPRSAFSAARLICLLPVACWGLLAYMGFQWWKFGQPLAFAITQEYHRMRPMGSLPDELLSLLSWEPIRDTYNPVSPGYWLALHSAPSRLFSLEFANPIYLVGTAALTVLGMARRWLTVPETLLAAGLISMSYFTRAYEMRMLSQARFMVVVFPAYIVMGELLARMPRVLAVALLALSGFMMGCYAALFAGGHPFL